MTALSVTINSSSLGSRPHWAAAPSTRAAGTLARKGYPVGLVFRLIKEVLEQERLQDPAQAEALDLDPDQYLDPDDPGE